MKDEQAKVCALRFKEALNDNNMKAQDLVELTSLPKATLSHYATGRRVPSRNTAIMLGNVLGVNPAWLMGFDVPKQIGLKEQKEQDEREARLVAYFCKLSQEQQESVLNLIKNMI